MCADIPPFIYGMARLLSDKRISRRCLFMRVGLWPASPSSAPFAGSIFWLAQLLNRHFDVVRFEQFDQLLGFLATGGRNVVNAAVSGVIFVA